ncbi:hypothetical protein FQ377_01065 [Arthrobacter echini]|uniref:Uncharacterized protein n=1 Tax=Arthrobacter echini TaxID=1529066 RepID=A0A5D0XU95_9MICC|nr:hypothetical protein FQ377_01065 [Arthrobacter echini]
MGPQRRRCSRPLKARRHPLLPHQRPQQQLHLRQRPQHRRPLQRRICSRPRRQLRLRRPPQCRQRHHLRQNRRPTHSCPRAAISSNRSVNWPESRVPTGSTWSPSR